MQPVASKASNSSNYNPADEVSRESDGSGGAPAVSGASGAEGAGNVEKTYEGSPSLYCAPEVLSVARDCAATLLVKNATAGFFCGASIGSLVDCLRGSK
jgi:hypothetical protein